MMSLNIMDVVMTGYFREFLENSCLIISANC